MVSYPDKLRTALMSSHRAEFKAELWFNDALVKELRLLGGSITADRTAAVRRTCQIDVDPGLVTDVIAGTLTPYGYYLKLYRGVRYIDSTVELIQVFHGRIEQVDASGGSVQLTGSDLVADLIDARFEAAWQVSRDVLVTDAMTAIIKDVKPSYTVTVTVPSTVRTNETVQYENERQAALDALGEAIGYEWYATMNGIFQLSPLPSLQAGQQPVWTVDAGDTGVMISRGLTASRTGIYNAVIALGESLNGTTIVSDPQTDTDPTSPTRYGGPFGKVPYVMQPSQTIASKIQANEAAKKMLTTLVAPAKAVEIECVPNPLLQLGDLIAVVDDPANPIGVAGQ